jgi:hypothetical protein
MQPNEANLHVVIARALMGAGLAFSSSFVENRRVWHMPFNAGVPSNYVLTFYIHLPYLICTVPLAIVGEDPVNRRRLAAEMLTLKLACIRLVPDAGLNEDSERVAWLRSEFVIGASGTAMSDEIVLSSLQNMIAGATMLLTDKALNFTPTLPKVFPLIGAETPQGGKPGGSPPPASTPSH